MSDTATDTAPGLVLPSCGRCGPCLTQFDDLLGHGHVGHRARNALAGAGFFYTAEVALATDFELLGIRNLGRETLDFVRERIPHAPSARERYSPTLLMQRVPERVRLEPWMLTEPDRASPLWLLSEFDPEDERIWANVHSRGISFRNIYDAGPWHDDERLMLRAARSLSGSNVGVDLGAAATVLNEGQWNALIEALRIRRDGSRSAS